MLTSTLKEAVIPFMRLISRHFLVFLTFCFLFLVFDCWKMICCYWLIGNIVDHDSLTVPLNHQIYDTFKFKTILLSYYVVYIAIFVLF